MASEDLDYSTQVVVSEGMETLEADSREGDCEKASEGVGPAGSGTDLGSEGKTMSESPRAEIDTSAPFESVREAATRFGGMGFWRPNSHKPSEHEFEAVDIAQVEEQAAQLEKDLMAKERETLDVMKELEATKMIVEELKLKLQKGATEVTAAFKANSEDQNLNASLQKEEKENNVNPNSNGALSLLPSSSPGVILMELKQAKFNLTRTTNDLAGIRAAVESYNKKIETERLSLERTRERLSSSSSKVSSLEEELSKTRLKLQQAQNPDIKGDSDNAVDISRELQQLSCEAEQYKKLGEAAKKEVFRAMSEIEQTKTRIKTAEIRLVAARKMKEAARATEAVALAEIKALSNDEQKPEGGVTLSYEEYTTLTSKAHEAEEASRRKVTDTMLLVDEANASRMEILKTVGEAAEEVKASKKVLEEALNRVEAANSSKLAVEEALRKWRSENGQKRRSVQSSTKFKNSSHPSHRRKDSHLTDVNGLNLMNDEPMPVLRPTLSIGQILSRKLFLTEEFGNGMKPEKGGAAKRKISLGQMLSRPKSPFGETTPFTWKPERETGYKQQLPLKRKKFGFARFSVLMRKQNNKHKKKRGPNFMCRSGLD